MRSKIMMTNAALKIHIKLVSNGCFIKRLAFSDLNLLQRRGQHHLARPNGLHLQEANTQLAGVQHGPDEQQSTRWRRRELLLSEFSQATKIRSGVNFTNIL